MADGELFRAAIEALTGAVSAWRPEYVVGVEARGFIFGAAIAERLGCGFVPARKPGKLPAACESVTYALEYGEDGLEIHRGSFPPGTRIAVVDDVLATGGTARAAGSVVTALGGDLVGWCFVLELAFLGGRTRLEGAPVYALTSLP